MDGKDEDVTHRANRTITAGTCKTARRVRVASHCEFATRTRLFTKLVLEYLSDEQYGTLQQTLMQNPDAGPVIPGSGGVRKLRWAAPRRGKRGGYRVIYYVKKANGVIWLLTMYPKNVAENIPTTLIRRIRQEVEDG